MNFDRTIPKTPTNFFPDLSYTASVKRTELTAFIRKHATGTSLVELHTVQVERGTSWHEAVNM